MPWAYEDLGPLFATRPWSFVVFASGRCFNFLESTEDAKEIHSKHVCWTRDNLDGIVSPHINYPLTIRVANWLVFPSDISVPQLSAIWQMRDHLGLPHLKSMQYHATKQALRQNSRISQEVKRATVNSITMWFSLLSFLWKPERLGECNLLLRSPDFNIDLDDNVTNMLLIAPSGRRN